MRKSKRIEEKAAQSPKKHLEKKRRKGGLEEKEEAAINSLLELARPSVYSNTSPEHLSTATLSLDQFLAEYDNPTGFELVIDGSVLRDISAFSRKVKEAFGAKNTRVK